MNSELTVRIQQKLQTNPVRGLSVIFDQRGLQAVSLNELPAVLKERYITSINTSAERFFGITPKEIFWDKRAKQGVLAHPTFLEELSKGFDLALKVLPKDIISAIDSETGNLYFFADDRNKTQLRRNSLVILDPITARNQMPTDLEAMVKIPGGLFTLGDKEQALEYTVQVDPFLINIFTVTNRLYREAIEDGLYRKQEFWIADGWSNKEEENWTAPDEYWFPQCADNKPIKNVSWYEVLAYCIWKSVQQGFDIKGFLTGGFFDFSKIYDQVNNCWIWQGYRLPTDAEIEIAIRGGLGIEHLYPWENGIEGNVHIAEGAGLNMEADVNDPKYPPNGYGIRHAVGNANIWALDEYHDEYFYKGLKTKGVVKNPAILKGRLVFVRGGGVRFSSTELYYQSSWRSNSFTNNRGSSISFRMARSIEP